MTDLKGLEKHLKVGRGSGYINEGKITVNVRSQLRGNQFRFREARVTASYLVTRGSSYRESIIYNVQQCPAFFKVQIKIKSEVQINR